MATVCLAAALELLEPPEPLLEPPAPRELPPTTPPPVRKGLDRRGLEYNKFLKEKTRISYIIKKGGGGEGGGDTF